MPRELVATAPRTPVLREYEEAPLGPMQIRIKTEFASPKHGTELVGYRNDPVANRPYDFAWGANIPRPAEAGLPADALAEAGGFAEAALVESTARRQTETITRIDSVNGGCGRGCSPGR